MPPPTPGAFLDVGQGGAVVVHAMASRWPEGSVSRRLRSNLAPHPGAGRRRGSLYPGRAVWVSVGASSSSRSLRLSGKS
jgi:hypothetical protein